MAKDEKPSESIELSIAGIFKLKLPPAIAQTLFGGSAATAEKLQRLSASATEKISAGLVPEADEQLAHELAMAPLRRKAARLAPAVARAAQILDAEPKLLPGYVEGEPPRTQTPPAEDWTDRWVDGASTTSDPSIREMWARTLAGEVTKPGTFSFKTMSVLKDVDSEYARAFVRLLGFCFNDLALMPSAVPSWREFREAYDASELPYGTFQRFEELGLLNFSGNTAIAELTPPMVLACGRYGFVIPNRVRAVSVHTLTRAGSELASLTDFKRSRAGLLAQGHWVQSHHDNVHLAVFTTDQDYEARPWDAERFTFDDATGVVGHIYT